MTKKSNCCALHENTSATKGETSFVASSRTEVQRSKSTQAVVWFLVSLIKLYQLFLSPLKPRFCRCRFTPTCSHYAKDAFLLHGPIKGAILATKRILRCNPWGGSGYDPVPPKQQKHR